MGLSFALISGYFIEADCHIFYFFSTMEPFLASFQARMSVSETNKLALKFFHDDIKNVSAYIPTYVACKLLTGSFSSYHSKFIIVQAVNNSYFVYPNIRCGNAQLIVN